LIFDQTANFLCESCFYLIFEANCELQAMKFLVSFFLISLAALHPLHVSYTSIDISRETGEIDLVCKFFTDDLKLMFYHFYDREIRFDPEKDLTGPEKDLVNRYVFNSIECKKTDGNPVLFQMIKKEQNEENIWIYYRGKLEGEIPDTVTIMNTLLLDIFEDQINLLILTCGSMEKGYRFDYRNRELQMIIKN
jgi:hypothetical protein